MIPSDMYSIEDRKLNGVFYTPQFLSEYLSNKIIQYMDKKNNYISVIDPACGDSMLLRSFYKSLSETNVGILKFYGIDKDENAINSSKELFPKKCIFNKLSVFIKTDSLFPYNNKNAKDGWSKIKEENNIKRGFDIAICNPPWGASLKEYDHNQLSENYKLAKGQYDIYDLFIESILNNLSENGIYALILPDSIFTHEQSGLRGLLASETTIHLIARLGEKIFPEINRACVLIIGCKKKFDVNHVVDCFRLSPVYRKQIIQDKLSLEEAEQALVHQVPQIRFTENDNYIFDIDLKTSETYILNKIENNCLTLRDISTNTRGIEISKKGVVCKCSICEKWMPFPKSKKPVCIHCGTELDISITDNIISEKEIKGYVKLKVGEDLYRFTSRSKYWINVHKNGINYKNSDIYRGDKILVRKTGVGITACIDYEGAYTNQVVYIVKLKSAFKSILSLEVVLAILNSRVITYFLLKKYGENEWRTHPYLTQSILMNLPFPKIDFSSKSIKKIILQITKLVRAEVVDSYEKNISLEADLYIEKSIAMLFNLNETDYEEIFITLNSAEQLIPIKRLTNCNAKQIFNTNGI